MYYANNDNPIATQIEGVTDFEDTYSTKDNSVSHQSLELRNKFIQNYKERV